MGSISLTIANPEGEQGPVAYYPTPGDAGVLDESLFIVDGDTVAYVGPMLKRPPTTAASRLRSTSARAP